MDGGLRRHEQGCEQSHPVSWCNERGVLQSRRAALCGVLKLAPSSLDSVEAANVRHSPSEYPDSPPRDRFQKANKQELILFRFLYVQRHFL